jgi:hypothetical protein
VFTNFVGAHSRREITAQYEVLITFTKPIDKKHKTATSIKVFWLMG